MTWGDLPRVERGRPMATTGWAIRAFGAWMLPVVLAGSTGAQGVTPATETERLPLEVTREQRLRQAMLLTYVHGVDDRLAAEVVAEQDLPELRRLLAEPGFPRRDNVVAFLGHRDG